MRLPRLFRNVHPRLFIRFPVAGTVGADGGRARLRRSAGRQRNAEDEREPKRRTRSPQPQQDQGRKDTCLIWMPLVSKDADTKTAIRSTHADVDLDDKKAPSPMERVGETPVEEPAQATTRLPAGETS